MAPILGLARAWLFVKQWPEVRGAAQKTWREAALWTTCATDSSALPTTTCLCQPHSVLTGHRTPGYVSSPSRQPHLHPQTLFQQEGLLHLAALARARGTYRFSGQTTGPNVAIVSLKAE